MLVTDLDPSAMNKTPARGPQPRIPDRLTIRTRVIIGNTPAPGVELIETVPLGVRWQLISICAQLKTSVAVANRIPSLVIDEGGSNIVFQFGDLAAQVASLTIRRSWIWAVAAATDALGNRILPIPNVELLAGWRLRTVTTAIDVADAWSQLVYVVRETLDTDPTPNR